MGYAAQCESHQATFAAARGAAIRGEHAVGASMPGTVPMSSFLIGRPSGGGPKNGGMPAEFA
jgi:hypothetical protein